MEERPGQEDEYHDGQYQDDQQNEQYEAEDQVTESGQITNIYSGNPNLNPKIQKRRSLVEQTHDLRVLLNKIFSMRGGWKVRNLAADFSDGFLFQELFNILYDEKIDCKLTPT